MERWDLVIVGGGPAGLSTALHLQACAPALAAHTLVLEKARYPREKFCAGGVGARALRRLAAIGVHLDVPSVPFRRILLRGPRETLEIAIPGLGRVVRRKEFDHALAAATRSRGITLRDGCGVRGIRKVDGGFELDLADDGVVFARAIVGADGVGGVVRKAGGWSPGTLRASVIECDTEAVVDDPPRDTLVFDASDPTLQGYAWDFPTLVEGSPQWCRGVYVLPAFGAENVQARLRAWLDAKGLDLRRYRLKPFGERGLDPREPLSKPGMLLVGEAAGIDIATGEGIAQAIAYGAIAAPWLARAFARGDLDFAGWRRHLWASGLGASLAQRFPLYAFWYGQPWKRAFTEALLVRQPGILDLLAKGFAGVPAGPLERARVGASLPLAAARAAWSTGRVLGTHLAS